MTVERINREQIFHATGNIICSAVMRDPASPEALYNCNLLPGCTLAACCIYQFTVHVIYGRRRGGYGGEQLQF